MASVHLVIGCPNARAGVKIVKKKKKKESLEQPRAIQTFDPLPHHHQLPLVAQPLVVWL